MSKHYDELIEKTAENGDSTLALEIAKFSALNQLDNEEIQRLKDVQDKKDAIAEREALRTIRITQAQVRVEQEALKQHQQIALARVGFAKQVASILSTIAEEGSNLAKVSLILEKGAAVADIIIKAQQSIATQTAASTAYSLQTQAAYASLPIAGPAIAASLIAKNKASLVKNIAQTKIGAGLSIAQILATSLTSKQKALPAVSAASTPSTSTPQIQAPAFNVVGATQTSQLAQTIAGSEEQPLRAYVVASDISTAQELERSTIEGASMG